jgi:hypothetical protein
VDTRRNVIFGFFQEEAIGSNHRAHGFGPSDGRVRSPKPVRYIRTVRADRMIPVSSERSARHWRCLVIYRVKSSTARRKRLQAVTSKGLEQRILHWRLGTGLIESFAPRIHAIAMGGEHIIACSNLHAAENHRKLCYDSLSRAYAC